MTTRDDNKRAMALKIKALLAKTTEAGCSEAEALLAAHKAKELLDKYQIDLSELDLREEGTDEAAVAMNAISRDLSFYIAKYCEVKSWRQNGQHRFLGLKSDVFFAEWLLLALTSFVQRKTLDFSLSNPRGIYQSEVLDFQSGAIARINERLKAEVDTRQRERATGTGRDLMVVKDQLITEAWARKNLTLKRGVSPRQWNVHSEAFQKGLAAGQEARFARPVARDEFETRALPARAKS